MVEAIARQGWTPLVASQGGRLVPAILRAGGRHIALPLKTKTPWGIWRNAGALARLMREERVNLVHVRSRNFILPVDPVDQDLEAFLGKAKVLQELYGLPRKVQAWQLSR